MNSMIVIGSGILGASTAYHLAKQGADVLLVDRNDAGQATEAAAGIVCPWLTNRRGGAFYRLVEAGARYYPELIEALKKDGETETGYSRVGAINIYSGETKLERKLALAMERRKDTPEMGEVSRLSAAETNALFPPLSDHYAAVHVSGAARVNGDALRNALIRGAEKHGAKVIRGDASLLWNGSNVSGVAVNHERFYANEVIVTGGAWARELLQPLGMKFLVSPQKAQIVHLDLPDTDTGKWPIVMPPFVQYFLPFENGRIVVGATQEDQAGFDLRVTMGGVHHIIDRALKVAPGFSDSTYVQTKVGFRPFTPGNVPIAGAVPRVKGLFVANGLGASGLTSGPFLGAELARLVIGERNELDLGEYDPGSAFR
ncbi:NAD(P)/FAD-dependent oxidoreductase [Pseudalkalibacillus hwajinpoensis]|uniref:NAD(P)/FAD-dependent oxidoreductase n=1 Tax=Guptibacillus hwajinpoensis TaxID=208199 RepID=UPI001CD454A3|nr:FAD-dependent oxidoreductase [Pseudalkalibacillus hwajinpoensis]MCA0993867.1 FAD-binding oxidoreductase [Pseudalkalibacillus hwajinpoensis]